MSKTIDSEVTENAAVSKVTLLPPVHVRPVLKRSASILDKEKRAMCRATSLSPRKPLTFGIIGEDSQLYPSAKWQSENRDQFAGQRSNDTGSKPELLITSLDARKHNPQTTQIFHIRRINKKPVCTVQWLDSKAEISDGHIERNTVYSSSFKSREREPRVVVHKNEKEKFMDGSIVPLNELQNNDARSEMMLPVCDSTMIQSAPNPHRYLLRKRKVPPPHPQKSNDPAVGVAYPSLEKPVPLPLMPERPKTGASKISANSSEPPERVSVSSLSGYAFSRRKYIPPPAVHFLNGFDCGVPEKSTNKFESDLMPFMRVKTII